MKTLIELYQNRKNELKNQLIQASSLSQYVDRIQDEINRFRDSKSEYIGNLTPSQANVALKGLEEINQSIILLKAVEKAQFYSSEPPISKGKSESSVSKSTDRSMIAVAVASGGAGSIATIFVGGLIITKKLNKICQPSPAFEKYLTKGYPDFLVDLKATCSFPQQFNYLAIIPTSPDIGGFLFGGMVAVIVVVIFFSLLKRKQRLEKQKPTTQLTQTYRTELEETINAILSYFKKKLEAIDNEVAKEGNKTLYKPLSPKIEDHPELLEILQNLIGLEADRNEQVHLPKLTRDLIKQIRQFLKLNNIEVIFYQPGMDDLSKFEFVSSSDAELKEHLTLIPSFVKNNHVILRGRVVKATSV
jgi:hypothetical protein